MGLTQEALAHDAGTSSSYLCAIETGKSDPTLPVMERLAGAFGIRLGYLMFDRISISVVSPEHVRIGAVPALLPIEVRRQPRKRTGRPRNNH